MASKADEVVRRLRHSRREHLDSSYEIGRSRGTFWAEDHADAGVLERLETLAGKGTYTASEQLAFALMPEYSNNYAWVCGFWNCIRASLSDVGKSLCNDDFARGFVVGALDVWSSVKDRVCRSTACKDEV